MKAVYRLINNNIQSEVVDDDYQLKENETFIKPSDGIYQPFSMIEGAIVGVQASEWVKTNEDKNNNNPKTNDQLLADLTQQFATTKITQDKTNALLLQQNAILTGKLNDLKAKETTNG